MRRREFLECAALAATPPVSGTGEVLYNGIRLPTPWPPRVEPLTIEPRPLPYYLQKPPDVLSIDVGRQLFVDDFLIAETNLVRRYHRPEMYPGNPVLRGDKPWENDGRGPMACPFSDGVWWDPREHNYKLWYWSWGGGFDKPPMLGRYATGYAFSEDGIHWEKPALDVLPGTNVVQRGWRDSVTIWLDHNEKDPRRRFKMFRSHPQTKMFGLSLHYSADGVHWSEPAAASHGPAWIGDRTTAFYNPFRKMWVYSIRIGAPVVDRSRSYSEHADAAEGLRHWELTPWLCADRLDPRNPDFPDIQPQLYNFDGFPYESLMVGLSAIWSGPDNRTCQKLGIPKRNQLLIGFSRDGFHWHRPDRQPFIPVNPSRDAWNTGNVQSAAGGCLIVDDKLRFYFSGRSRPKSREDWDANGSTGMALLRRDGFVSMQAGAQGGVLTTRPLQFRGRYLFVNADAAHGEVRAEVLDESGKVMSPFTARNCRPVGADRTAAAVEWKGARDLARVAGRPVRLRFHVRSASLYAFWVTPDRSGASHGYVAAGGPAFDRAVDDVGQHP